MKNSINAKMIPQEELKMELRAHKFFQKQQDVEEEEDKPVNLDSMNSAITLNREYQDLLREKITEIKNILHVNMIKKCGAMNSLSAKRDVKYQNAVKKHRKPITLFASPYFRDIKGFVPEKNEDALEKEALGEIDAYDTPQRPWNAGEYKKLQNGVYRNILQRKVTPLLNKINAIEQKLQREIYPNDEELKMKNEISNYHREIKNIEKLPMADLVRIYIEDVDWLTVSSTYMGGCRKAEDCQTMWENFVSPSINRKKFSPEEDEQLEDMAKKHRRRNWQLIADELGTGRTAIQCLERYQTKHNPKISKVFWTPEEDEYLLRVVNTLKMGEYIPWYKVMYYIHGRTRMQVTNRWTRIVAPGLKTGPFCTEEDALLYASIQKYGHNWRKVCEFLPWRSACTCRERFLNFLDLDVRNGSWSFEEDLNLLKQISIHGEGKWSKISRALSNRTDAMCATRATILKRHDINYYKALTKKGNKLTEKDKLYPKCQFAPSKSREGYRESRRHLLNAAIQCYMAYFQRFTGVTDMDSLPKNESGIVIPSVKLLKMMRDDLMDSCEHVKSLPCVAPDYDFGVSRKSAISKKEYQDTYDDDFNLAPELVDISESDSEVEMLLEQRSEAPVSKEKEIELKQQLECLFIPKVLTNFIKTGNNLRTLCYRTGKNLIKYDMFKKMLFQDFGFMTSDCIQEEDIPVKDKESIKSLSPMIRLFVMPECKEGTLPLICPNDANLTSMLMCLLNRKSPKADYEALSGTSTLRNIMAITADRKNLDRRCAECLKDHQMNGHDIETQSKKCVCDEISIMRKRLIILRRRFMSVFLLPLILSKVPMSEEQTKLLYFDLTAIKKEFFKPKRGLRRRKRKYKKAIERDDDDESDFDEKFTSPPEKKPVQFTQTRTRCVRLRSSNWDDIIANARCDEDEESM